MTAGNIILVNGIVIHMDPLLPAAQMIGLNLQLHLIPERTVQSAFLLSLGETSLAQPKWELLCILACREELI